jgi:hypothetical protein
MKRVFLPMDREGQPQLEEPGAAKASGGVEKRRHTRHRYTVEIEVRVDEDDSVGWD